MPNPLSSFRVLPKVSAPSTAATRLANRLYWLVSAGALAGVVAMLSSPWWMTADWLLQLAAFQWRLTPEHTPAVLAPDALWGARLAVLLPGAAGLWAVLRLRRLAAHYRSGALFDLQAAQLLRDVGYGVSLSGGLQALTPTLAMFALTLHNPPGHRLLALGISFESYTLLIVGTLFVLLAHVMLEAARIAQENQEFV